MNSSGESDDDNESDGQMGKKVDLNEVLSMKIRNGMNLWMKIRNLSWSKGRRYRVVVEEQRET